MGRVTAAVFALLLLAGALLPGCSKDQLLDTYSAAVAAAGNIGLTSGLTLQGERQFGADRYTGTYSAEYKDFTGRECPFGGTMLERREQQYVQVCCTIQGQGDAKLVWQCGAAEPVTLAEGEGTFSQTAYLSPGSNYFNLELEQFTGSIDLRIE